MQPAPDSLYKLPEDLPWVKEGKNSPHTNHMDSYIFLQSGLEIYLAVFKVIISKSLCFLDQCNFII